MSEKAKKQVVSNQCFDSSHVFGGGIQVLLVRCYQVYVMFTLAPDDDLHES